MSLDAAEAAELFEADDPELRPAEKETTFRFSRDDDRAEVYTLEAGLGRRLLLHPFVEIRTVTVADGMARPERALEDLDGDETIVGVRANAPIGLLQIKSTPRRSGQHAEVVTDRVLDEEYTIGGGERA